VGHAGAAGEDPGLHADRHVRPARRESGWFEEDCDVCWVVACFPDLFGSQKATAACGVMSATFDCLRKGMDASRERNWIMALRCAYAKNGLAYGWQTVEA
jgi:hypothetical protein